MHFNICYLHCPTWAKRLNKPDTGDRNHACSEHLAVWHHSRSLPVDVLWNAGVRRRRSDRSEARVCDGSTVERPVGTAIVGNPEVADISVRAGDKKVVVTAKKAIGATNLIILDVDDKEMFNAEINVAGNLSGSTRGAVHVQPTVNRHALHNFQAYYCPPGGGLCQRVNDPNANLSQLQMVGPPQPQTSIPNTNVPPSVTAPSGASPESAPGLSQ